MNIKARTKKLKRSQLDARLSSLRELHLEPPKGGWIRQIREALGLTATQLGQRIGMAKQNVRKMERAEEEGRITVSSLKRAAEGMGCDVRVVLIPRQNLESMVQQQALRKATEIVRRTNLHMSLENQGTEKSFQDNQIQEMADEFVRTLDRRFWDEIPSPFANGASSFS